MIGYMLVWEDRAAIHKTRKAVMETFGHIARLFPKMKRPRIAVVQMEDIVYSEGVTSRDQDSLIGEALTEMMKDSRWSSVEIIPPGSDLNVYSFRVKMSNGVKQGEGGGVFLPDAIQMARNNMNKPDVEEVVVEGDIVYDKIPKKSISLKGLKLNK